MNFRQLGLYYSILHHTDRILSKVERFSVDEELWFSDADIRDMVYVSVEQVGERAAKLDADEARSEFPDVPWSKVVGLRTIIAHDYDNINAKIVWDVINSDIPELRTSLLGNETVSGFYEQQLSQIEIEASDVDAVRSTRQLLTMQPELADPLFRVDDADTMTTSLGVGELEPSRPRCDRDWAER